MDGVSIAGDQRQNGSELISGEEGSAVTLTILREDGATLDVSCTRASLQNPSAAGQMLEDDIGYVQLSNFYSGAADSFKEEVDALVSQGARALVIDLRNNPGGVTCGADRNFDYLLPEGVVFGNTPAGGLRRRMSRMALVSIFRLLPLSTPIPILRLNYSLRN